MMVEVIGTRIRLRSITPDDFAHIQRWRSDPEVTRYWISREIPTIEHLQQWLEGKQRTTDLGFVIEDETGSPVGVVDLFNIDREHRRAELSLMIGERDRQGLGYGRETLQTILRFAFANRNAGGLEMHKISLAVFAENLPARRLYERCGFHEDGILRDDMYYDGAWHDQILMSVLAHEFKDAEE